MKRDSFVRSRRGVSEIIADLILMLIISSAGIVAYSYSIGAFTSSSSIFQLDTSSQENQAQERFAIIAVWEGLATTNQLNLTVLNYGQIGLTINAVYINWTTVTNYLPGWNTTIGNGALVQVGFISPITIQSGSNYQITVVSTRGSTNAITWKA
jgi:hypothetical protein